MIERRFSSRLSVDADKLWRDVTGLSGINAELAPYLRMRSVDGIADLSELQTDTGVAPLLVDLRLGGTFPFGRAQIEIVELGRWHFVERSDQPLMRCWQHRRSVIPHEEESLLVDRLTFAPRIAPGLAARAIDFLFAHRHARLRARWGGGDG